MLRRLIISVFAVAFVTGASVAFDMSSPVDATQGQAVIAGALNTATAETIVVQTDEFAGTCTSTFAASGLTGCGFYGVFGLGAVGGVRGEATGSGFVDGILGLTSQAAGQGVRGLNNGGGVGVRGNGGTGVRGEIQPATGGIGVQGVTNGHHSQIAVDGDTLAGNGEGIAVRGRTKNGIALYGEATGGFALQVVGRAVFSRSGKTTISAGQSTRTVSGHLMAGATIVVATVQGNPAGVWVRNVSVSDANDTFTIRLNKAAPSGGVTVGFFIVN